MKQGTMASLQMVMPLQLRHFTSALAKLAKRVAFSLLKSKDNNETAGLFRTLSQLSEIKHQSVRMLQC